MALGLGIKHQDSGFWDCSIIYNFTVLLFYFFEKKNTGTLEHLGKHFLNH